MNYERLRKEASSEYAVREVGWLADMVFDDKCKVSNTQLNIISRMIDRYVDLTGRSWDDLMGEAAGRGIVRHFEEPQFRKRRENGEKIDYMKIFHEAHMAKRDANDRSANLA